MPAKISEEVDMETPHCVYNGDARASEIRSLETNQLFGLMVERTRRSRLQRGLRDQQTFDLPCPTSNILADPRFSGVSLALNYECGGKRAAQRHR